MSPLLACLWVAAELSQPGAAFRQPQLASYQRFVGVTFGSENTVYFAGSSDQGNTFTAPVKVADAPKLALGSHRGPRLAYTRGALVIAAGVGADDLQHGLTRLLTWRSTDGGKTWSAGPRIDEGQHGGEGFVGLAADHTGAIHAVWTGLESKRVKVFAALSKDGGATWSGAKTVYTSPDGNVCECCHPSIAIGASGELLIMWRNALDGARDMYLARSKNGDAFAVSKLGEGTWPLKACPMDGGGISERNGEVTTVWRRDLDVFLARPGQAETKIGRGRNPAVALGREGVYAMWSSPEGLMALRPGSETAKVFAQGSFPSLAGGMQVVAAWESGGKITIAKLD